MPITSKIKVYHFEVSVKTKKVKGVILSCQIKSLDFKSRKIKFKGGTFNCNLFFI